MIKCTLCNGSGELPDPYKLQLDTIDIKRKIAHDLKSKGYSLRQIQSALNYKSVGSIQKLLKP